MYGRVHGHACAYVYGYAYGCVYGDLCGHVYGPVHIAQSARIEIGELGFEFLRPFLLERWVQNELLRVSKDRPHMHLCVLVHEHAPLSG